MKVLQVKGTSPQQYVGYDEEIGVCFTTTARSLAGAIGPAADVETCKAHAAADTGVPVENLELVEL